MRILPLTQLASCLVLGLASSAAMAQSSKITFTNTDLGGGVKQEVKLLDGTDMTVSGTGDFSVQCETETVSGVLNCKGVSSSTVQPGNPPDLSFGRSDTNSEVETGESITLAWSTANPTADLCVASATPANANWTGLKGASGSQAISFAAAGTYTFSLVCYGAEGKNAPTPAVSVAVTGPSTPPPPVDGCSITSSDPLFRPPVYSDQRRTWAQVFNGVGFPQVTTATHPVGAFTIGDASLSTRYISVPFTPEAGKTYVVDWFEAQVLSAVGYRSQRPGEAWVTISPCAGDFRPVSTVDNWTKRGCRRFGQSEALTFSTNYASSTNSFCAVEAGKQYYLNIAFFDPALGGAALGTTTCQSGSLCEVMMKLANVY